MSGGHRSPTGVTEVQVLKRRNSPKKISENLLTNHQPCGIIRVSGEGSN
jgi:hypothetical protein